MRLNGEISLEEQIDQASVLRSYRCMEKNFIRWKNTHRYIRRARTGLLIGGGAGAEPIIPSLTRESNSIFRMIDDHVLSAFE